MNNSPQPIYTPNLEEAIDYHPLIVAPDTPVLDAIAMMSRTHRISCSLGNSNCDETKVLRSNSNSSCVLVIEKQELLGIFTERDIVRLTATGCDLTGATIADVMISPVITVEQENFRDIFAAVFLFRRYRIRHLPIVNRANKLVGIVSQESLRQVLRPANLLKLRRVAEVMTSKVIHAPVNASVIHLAKLMATYRVSCVVITQESTEFALQPVGIVTERDIVQFQFLQLSLAGIEAQEVMSTPLFLLNPEDSLWKAHQEMQRRRVRRLVVSWNWGRDLGIVTQTSLLRVFDPMEMYGIIETLQRTVEQLQGTTTDIVGNSSLSPEKKEKLQLEAEVFSRQERELQNDSSEIPSSSVNQELVLAVSKIQVCLESLVNEPQMATQIKQIKINSILNGVKKMSELLFNNSTQQNNSQDSETISNLQI